VVIFLRFTTNGSGEIVGIVDTVPSFWVVGAEDLAGFSAMFAGYPPSKSMDKMI
jgi:hypothetical protein